MKSGFNENLYNASLKGLTENGVPEDIAEKASFVLATDQPGITRTQQEQADVNEAVKHYWQNQRGEDEK